MKNKLSPNQEKLLMRHFDDECGFFDRVRVKRMLNNNADAARFLADLKIVGSQFETSQQLSSTPEPGADLWSKIEMRIAQEERSAIFLGKRANVESSNFLNRLVPSLEMGLSGALVTAALATFVIYFRPMQNSDGIVGTGANQFTSNIPVTAANPIVEVQPVADLGGAATFNNNSQVYRSPFEVDWMRSDGRVRMIQPSRERGPIIWVKPRSGNRIVSTEQGSNSDLMIINKRIPQTLSVGNPE